MERLRRLFTSLGLGALLAGFVLGGTAAATPPESSGIVARFEEVGLVGYQDAAEGLVALSGPPAELGCLGIGFEDYFTTLHIAATPSGAVVLHIRQDEVPLYVYGASSFEELCAAVVAGVDLELVASGTVRFVHNDNDVFVTGSRINAFGDTATGVLTGPDGGLWSFRGTFRGLVEGSVDGECICRILREDISLTARGG